MAIDIETGAFEVADEILTATDRLFEQLPDAQPWIVRIGHRAVHRFGARSLRATVIWDGQYRNIPVNKAETDPLVGMSLLYGYDLQIRAVEGGNVIIKAIE